MTRVLNLYGGPGTGKSTTAAYMFYLLKQAGKNIELVREYVKNWAYENRNIGTYDQFYFLSKQIREESMLYGKVDYIVTDCPVLLTTVYADKYCPRAIANSVRSSAMGYYEQSALDGHKHDHIMLKRTKPYNQSGRYQDENAAKEINKEVDDMLFNMLGQYYTIGTDEESIKTFIKSYLGE